MDRPIVLVSKPPIKGRWPHGIPGYSDNPAMEKGYVPNKYNVLYQQEDLVRALRSTRQVDIEDIDFPTTRNSKTMQTLQKVQEYNKRELGANLGLLNPNGEDIVDDTHELTQHDFVFVRDSFLSNQKDKILISGFSRQERIVEEKIMREILENITKKRNIDREIKETPKGLFFEGGNFRYSPKEEILFAGKQKRNNEAGIRYVQNEFRIKDENLLMIDGDGFHLDTYFSTITDTTGDLIAGIICPKLVHNMEEIREFFIKKRLDLREIDDSFGMGEEANGTGNLATNTIQIGNYLIGCNRFDERTEIWLEKLGIKRLIVYLRDFNKSGGGVHCLTNFL